MRTSKLGVKLNSHGYYPSSNHEMGLKLNWINSGAVFSGDGSTVGEDETKAKLDCQAIKDKCQMRCR